MAGLFNFPQKESDESEYAKWLRKREADIAARPGWLELPVMAAQAEAQPRQVQARPGDSISKLLGTSDQAAIGAFARANGLGRGDSTIYAGRTYVLPDDRRNDDDWAQGTMMLRRDNARLAILQAKRRQERALSEARARWWELVLGPLPARVSYSVEKPSTSEGSPQLTGAKPGLANRISEAADAALARLPSRWDRDPAARAVGGFLAREAGKNIGHATGAVKTVEDIGSGAIQVARLFNPLDPILSEKGDAAWDNVFGGIGSAIDYGASRAQNFDLLRNDVSHGIERFRRSHDPSATPAAPALGEEMRRRFNIGKNYGELEVDAGSLALGGGGLKTLSVAGKAGELTGAAKWIAKGFTPAQAEYLAAPYQGMGHHFWRRAGIELPFEDANGEYIKLKLPKFISDSQFNVKKPRNISRGDFYELHYKVDPSFYSAKIRREFGGGYWVGSELGYDKYSPLGMIWHGSPTPLKATVGAASAAPGLTSYELSRARE